MKREDLDKVISEETVASERTRDEPISGQATRKRQTRSVVYSVRLTPSRPRKFSRSPTAPAFLLPGWYVGGSFRGLPLSARTRSSRQSKRWPTAWPYCAVRSRNAGPPDASSEAGRSRNRTGRNRLLSDDHPNGLRRPASPPKHPPGVTPVSYPNAATNALAFRSTSNPTSA